MVYTLFSSCVEELAIESTEPTSSLLVIDARITDELRFHQIRLTRTYALGAEGPIEEQDAQVKIITDFGAEIVFNEVSAGIYQSSQQFAAEANTNYKLSITTSDQKVYESANVQRTEPSEITEIVAEATITDLNEEGVRILVNSNINTSEPQFFKYEYEETYKVIAPLYSPQELVVLEEDFPYPPDFLQMFVDPSTGIFDFDALVEFFFDFEFNDPQEQVCFKTVASNNIIQASTEDLIENELANFEVRFISRFNTILKHRYSILVKQFVQSEEAYNFFQLLDAFSSNDNLFSEVQTGFLEGNITNITNPSEQVVGFFEVSAYNEHRVFFNFEDIFPGLTEPPYFINCDDTISPAVLEEDFAHNITNSPIIDALNTGFIFYELTEVEGGSPFSFNPFQLVFSECGDCTNYGSTEVPEFWEE